MQSVKDILALKSELETTIRRLNSALNSQSNLSVGDHYNKISFPSDDADVRALMSLKVDKMNEQLKPINHMLRILDDLAAKTLERNSHGE